MKRKRYTAEHITAILTERGAGAWVPDGDGVVAGFS
jgi:hypothetical protein